MSDRLLRKRLIRLAHINPEIRSILLPLLREAREDEATDQITSQVRELKIVARWPNRMRMMGLADAAVSLLRIVSEEGRREPALKHFANRSLREAKRSITDLLGTDEPEDEI